MKRCQRTQSGRGHDVPDPGAGAGIGDLVMVLEKVDEIPRLEIKAWRAPCAILPVIALPLEQVSVFRSRHELLSVAMMIVIIGFVAASERHCCGVMKVVVPECVQIVAALIPRPHHIGLLRLILADEVHLPSASR